MSGGLGAGSFPGPVRGAVHEDLVAGVDQAVQQRFSDDGVGEQWIPSQLELAHVRCGCFLLLAGLSSGLRVLQIFKSWSRYVRCCLNQLGGKKVCG